MNRIAQDTFAGRRMLRSNKVRSDVFTAQELAAMATKGRELILWEFSGHVGSVALYVRTRFVGQEDGSLIGYASDGHMTVIHPAERKIRVMTK